MTKKTSPKAAKAATPKKANAFQVFLAEYKVGKESPYMEGARKAWNAKKGAAAKSKSKEAATDSTGSK